MGVVGVVICFAFGLMITLDGLLNLGGCGDRFEDKHKRGNWLVVGAGVLMMFLSIYLK